VSTSVPVSQTPKGPGPAVREPVGDVDPSIHGPILVRSSPIEGWTLRRKLVASILALFVVITLATGTATVFALRKNLSNDLDTRVAQLVSTPPPIGFRNDSNDSGAAFAREGLYIRPVTNGAYAQASNVKGEMTTLTAAQVSLVVGAGIGSTPTTVDLGGDLGEYRIVATTDREGNLTYRGLPEFRIDRTVMGLAALTAAFRGLGLLLVGVGGWWLVGANLRPLERVARTATRVATLPLSSGAVSLKHERVPDADTDRRTEVGQVGAALNDLLDHVDRSLTARHESEMRLRQFVADASHELRTPLASIKGYAELSRKERDPVPETVTHALGRIESETGRMASLVEDLLLLARLDAGRPLERTPVDLTKVTIDAVSDLRAAGPHHQWRLDLPEEAVEAVGDEARLTQVVINLLNNARVHTPEGTTVSARVRRDSDTAIVEVEDNGPGIAPDLLPHVFGRFTRGDTARTRKGGSSGLGLSIVHAVAAAHGGTVGVRSTPGRTIFTLRLPIEGKPLAPPA
jgi:two-component system, OmpR family, sensor kinase